MRQDVKNIQLQKDQFADCEVIHSEGLGDSVVLRHDLTKDMMVDCYWGVIKSAADMDKLNPVDVSYSMRLTKTKYVDASKEGGLMRFCLHSCNGTVRSETRLIDGFFVCK